MRRLGAAGAQNVDLPERDFAGAWRNDFKRHARSPVNMTCCQPTLFGWRVIQKVWIPRLCYMPFTESSRNSLAGIVARGRLSSGSHDNEGAVESAACRKNIVIATIGSLGDLHPCLALGRELLNRGCRVTIATTPTTKARWKASVFPSARCVLTGTRQTPS